MCRPDEVLSGRTDHRERYTTDILRACRCEQPSERAAGTRASHGRVIAVVGPSHSAPISSAKRLLVSSIFVTASFAPATASRWAMRDRSDRAP